MRSALAIVLVLALVWATAAIGACSGRNAPEPAPEFEQVYTTRGIIRGLPDPARPATDLLIQHEEIPEFINGHGETSGMRSMTMPFPTLADGVSLESIGVGDKVRVTFGVVWNRTGPRPVPRWVVTEIDVLPEDTALELGVRTPQEVPAVDAEDGADGPG